jgi:hypothetical protein
VALRRHKAPLGNGVIENVSRASVYTIAQAGGAKVVAGSDPANVATNAFTYAMPRRR